MSEGLKKRLFDVFYIIEENGAEIKLGEDEDTKDGITKILDEVATEFPLTILKDGTVVADTRPEQAAAKFVEIAQWFIKHFR